MPRVLNTYHCPTCGADECTVIDARATSFGRYKRRRECRKCGHLFTTYEITAERYDELAKRTIGARRRLLIMLRRVERELAEYTAPVKTQKPKAKSMPWCKACQSYHYPGNCITPGGNDAAVHDH